MPASRAYPEVVISMPNVPFDGEESKPCISGSQATFAPGERVGQSRSGVEVDAEG